VGKIALAAKVTHVTSMVLPQIPGMDCASREAALEGQREIARRARAMQVDTVVVFDSDWPGGPGYCVNGNVWLEGSGASAAGAGGLPYGFAGNPMLAQQIVEAAARRGVATTICEFDNLALDGGTVVPMQTMNPDQGFKVVACAAGLGRRPLEDSRAFGAAVREAIVASDSIVMVLASGSLSHRLDDRTRAEADGADDLRAFDRQVDLRVVDLWTRGDWPAFCTMLPAYAELCHGDGGMHDTAMLLGLLGWDEYDRSAEIVTAYFTCAGTGQLNAVLPVD
jgi:3,4-dihydroxyphenylacetate 2,3-dioxygenase